jgi:signal transduction histidine kinase
VENRIFPSPDGGLAIFVRYITERKRAEQGRQHLLEQLVSAHEEERGRLARELHDSLGQQLTALHLGPRQYRSATTAPPAWWTSSSSCGNWP